MKLIGTLTFHRALNYGATLQAYALVETLRGAGADARVIDYRCPKLEGSYRLVKDGEALGPKTLPKAVFRLLKRRKFAAFERRRMRFTRMVSDSGQLAELAGELDAVVVGSDQVWNDACTGADDAFYLSFARGKAVAYSYAASVGAGEDVARGILARHRDDLSQLDGASLREGSGVRAFEAVTGMPARKDVDPVLLLDRATWEGVASPRILREPYLFMYLVGGERHIRRFAEGMGARRGLKLVDNKTSLEFLLHNGPEDFLSWIMNADMVVTNSFHGTAFSVIFQKDAWFELNVAGAYNMRSEELLASLSIEGREVMGDDLPDDVADIDWEGASRRLEVLRADSLAYIERIAR